ncbi:MAG: XdhC family protein [Haloferacaceae archaeon]
MEAHPFDPAGAAGAPDGSVLVTVVRREGRAYRGPGSKLLVRPDGSLVGGVDAGRPDPAALRAAASDGPLVRTVDLSADPPWGLGTSNGVVDLLLEPFDGALRPVAAAAADGRPTAVATLLDESCPRLALVDGRVAALRGPVPGRLAGPLARHLRERAADGTAGVVTADGTPTLVDGTWTPPTLLVCGAGADVRPVATLGADVGFRPVVAALGDRSPPAPADARTLSTAPDRLPAALDAGERTYAVLATHDFDADLAACRALLDAGVPYVGVVGPDPRARGLLEELPPADRDRVYAPVGLDVGTETPEEVAVSVVGEVLAVRAGRTGGHLRVPERERGA